MSDETRTRFLAAIARQIPADRVIEVHLFAAIRQAGMESGIAVVALERVAQSSTSLDVDGGYEPSAAVAATALVESDAAIAVHDQLADEAAFAADELGGESSPYADDPAEAAAADEDFSAATRPVSRYTIYSARYRYTLKGLDRGKWEVSVTEEADAPLLTVDAVVRGVQRRSGDEDDVLRLSGDEFRSALPTALPVA